MLKRPLSQLCCKTVISTYLQTVVCCYCCLLLTLFANTAYSANTDQTEFVKGKICIGTNGRMSVPANRDHHYRNLRDRYMNCTYVDGNLELTWLKDENLDLSFLQYIREVTGYVLISHIDIKRIVLPRLQIIRGRTLFKLNIEEKEFSLLVTMSKIHNVEMPALRDILQGSVGFYNNYNLCHIKSINWEEIITGPGAKYFYVYKFGTAERECPPCDKSCIGGCWGEGPENCQKFSKVNCSPQCYQGRCFGPKPRECCHLFCAGGCTGPKQTDCLACRSVYDDGVCTQECPPMQRYNPITYSWETNPDGKYAYGATCVKNCPEHLLKDSGACVKTCPRNKRAVNGECVPCDGPCPKTCTGVAVIGENNIEDFKDCTVIEGSISILDQTFKGYQEVFDNYSFGARVQPMHPDRLEVFSTLKEVTGYINIQGYHNEFTNLSYFRNLEVIGGREFTPYYFASLYIVKTSLQFLGLTSLKKISSGGVAILENKDLCYTSGIDWKKIKKSVEHGTLLQSNKNHSACVNDNEVCDSECSADGCWGPGSNRCISCAHFQFEDRCLPSCDAVPGLYKSNVKLCMPCHSECESMCNGPGPEQCTLCKHVRDGPFCAPFCPDTKYNDNKICRSCHRNCVKGCNGPENTIGANGCVSCDKAIINGDVVEKCLRANETCPDGYYYEWVGPHEQGVLKPLAGKAICRRCHPRCKKCTGYGFHEQVCQECASYKRGEQCEDECPQDHYADNVTHECISCHPECRACAGPLSTDCLGCRNFKVYLEGGLPDKNNTSFNCTANCPPEFPHKAFPEENSDPYCSLDPGFQPYGPEKGQIPEIMLIILFGLLVGMGSLITLGCMWQKKAAKDNAVKMSMALVGLDDNEPLQPTNVKPNLAKLRIVKEAEIRKGGVLGYGAFGTVYKGVWVPEGENNKIPVAIKVLRGNEANTSNAFLEEAYIMASMEHPNLLQLLAVCMTSNMMLITQLMPLGCLLDYVRKNKDKIGSKPLLNWCSQIARGMAYLEEKRLVHRDLAARNVLVQTPSCVKITDFGLAKLLDINEEEYKAAGGKMPIKWLALECIQHRIFTHKSDVWAFGVTIWEILTYGGRPYENVPARSVPELLEKGGRLPQPKYCSLDIYVIMNKCWWLDANGRPTFEYLAKEFAQMARDPGRWLNIPGDRFMKLPSYTPQDENEMISRMVVETHDGLTNTPEYLQPKIRAASTSTVTSVVDSPAIGLDNTWDRELLQFAYDCPQRRQNNNTAYMNKGSETSDEVSGESSKREAQVGSLKLELPLDDEDYLVPSPQPSHTVTVPTSTRYMEAVPANENNTNLKATVPSAMNRTCVDNPEYHMMSTGDHKLGIPFTPRPRLSEEESDHEYYNDFDRLQRELQPLRRNETTV